jgi:hypothetical protein
MASVSEKPLYSPLGPSEIRLLTLYPGKAGDVIRGSLKHATLEIREKRTVVNTHWLEDNRVRNIVRKLRQRCLEPAKPVYDALSYCWGQEGNYDYIELNGHKVAVRRNLWCALEHFRYRALKTRRLWIDALCINQDDTVERSAQVPMMGSIYNLASKVLIWLGEATTDSDAAIRAFGHFYRIWRDDSKRDKFLSEHGEKCVSLMERPYWSRLWIIQEVCFASELEAHCGSESTSWKMLCHFWEDAVNGETAIRGTCLTPNLVHILDLKYRVDISLFQLLYVSRVVECSDPRDKIYGLIGLMDSKKQRPVPHDTFNYSKILQKQPEALPIVNYSKSLRQIYCDFMRWYFLSAGCDPDDILHVSRYLQEVLGNPFLQPSSFTFPQLDFWGLPVKQISCSVHGYDVVDNLGPLMIGEYSTINDRIKWTRSRDIVEDVSKIAFDEENSPRLKQVRPIVQFKMAEDVDDHSLQLDHTR